MFGRFQTANKRNNTQQLATGCAKGRTYNIQQCWELLASNVASVCRGLRATEHSPVPCVLIGIFPVPDKYYVLMVNLFLPIFTLDKWHFTSHLRLLLLFWRIKWWLPLKKKNPCIRRQTATIESQYNEFHHWISNETIIPIVCMYNYVDEGTSVSQQQRFAVTALMLNPDTKKDLRFQPLSKQVF